MICPEVGQLENENRPTPILTLTTAGGGRKLCIVDWPDVDDLVVVFLPAAEDPTAQQLAQMLLLPLEPEAAVSCPLRAPLHPTMEVSL
jgi:hypothetical protein